MKKTKVLVVDDAVVVRRMVSDVLSGDPALEIIAVAANGRIALEKILLFHPDIVILDIEMPVMNGLETLVEIRKKWQDLPVIMFSTLTEHGAKASLDALALGANDYVTKPANVGCVVEAQRCLRDDLIPRIKALVSRVPLSLIQPHRSARAEVERHTVAVSSRPRERIDIVVIGISTGGPNALAELVPALPGDLPVPVMVVQHMPPLFTRFLAQRLHDKSALSVCEGASGVRVDAGSVFLAPGGFHMVIERERKGCPRIALNQDPPENSCRPAADVLFRSAARVFGSHVLAVVMTGMGEDGLRGCHEIRKAGGQVIAQDRESSVIWGMPGAVCQAGMADEVLALDRLADTIVHRTEYGRVHRAMPSRESKAWA